MNCNAFLSLDLAVVDGELMFTSSNEGSELCISIQSTDDNFVESSMTVELQLQSEIQNSRILISPSDSTLVLMDNDGMT